VDIHIKKIARAVHMQIQDNGKSFDVNKILNTTRSRRMGLIGMNERAQMVGGTFTIKSSPDKGTRLNVQIPVNGTAKKESPHET
jgi:signal transduction histidine kinase